MILKAIRDICVIVTFVAGVRSFMDRSDLHGETRENRRLIDAMTARLDKLVAPELKP